MNIGIVGLGRLGLPMAVFYASRGFDVVGIDSNRKVIRDIGNGMSPIGEPNLQRLLNRYERRINATIDYRELMDSDIIFIIVPTPSDNEGRFSSDYVIGAVENIASILKNGNSRLPLIVVTSTVMPNTMDREVLPLLKRMTKRDVPVCYNPEFIALGSVINDMRNPDSILIGESDKESGDRLEYFYKLLHKQHTPPICRMSLINSEIAKISLNVALTVKVSYSNVISNICELTEGGSVEDVLGFVGLDSRINPKYMKSGLGYGGTCLPRDNRAFMKYARDLNYDCPMQEATDIVNKIQPLTVIEKVNEIFDMLLMDGSIVISVLGITYKKDTPIIEDSQALEMVKYLASGYEIRVYDPQGMDNAMKVLGEKVYYADSIEDCLKDSELCIVATEWGEFKDITEALTYMKTPRLLDCWRMYNGKILEEEGIEYYALGINK